MPQPDSAAASPASDAETPLPDSETPATADEPSATTEALASLSAPDEHLTLLSPSKPEPATAAPEANTAESAEDKSALHAAKRADLRQQFEALIFASDEALPPKTIRTALGEKISDAELDALATELNAEYEQSGRTFRVHHLGGGYRFLTEKQFHGVVQNLMQPKLQRRLSQSALETLAIIAYKQPLSKAEIEAIRGVNADYVIRALLEKQLVEVSGRSEAVGKPLLYRTTKEFLDYFNLSAIGDLPKPREISELMKDGDAQQQLQAELNDRLKLELEDDAEPKP